MTKFYFRDELADGLNENSQVVMKSVQIEGQKKATDFMSAAFIVDLNFRFLNHRIEVTQRLLKKIFHLIHP